MNTNSKISQSLSLGISSAFIFVREGRVSVDWTSDLLTAGQRQTFLAQIEKTCRTLHALLAIEQELLAAEQDAELDVIAAPLALEEARRGLPTH